MGQFEFTDDLLTRHPDVDRQHRALFKMADVFARMESPPAEVILKVLDFMQRYIVHHFVAEQQAMELIFYPRLRHHSIQHKIFTDHVAEVYRAAAGGEAQAAVVARLHALFHEWFVEHINAMDRPLAEALREAQVAETHPMPLPTPVELNKASIPPTRTLRLEDVHWDGDGESWLERMAKHPFGRKDR